MKKYNTLAIETGDFVCTLWLNRPERHNALNRQMALELIDFLAEAERDPNIRVLIVRGKDGDFCSGGDLRWVSSDGELSVQDRPGFILARLFRDFYRFPKPLIALVEGVAIGGGLGLIASADFVLAKKNASFSFSELNLGLVPATISPFVIRRIGEYNARQLIFSAATLTATEAKAYHLVDFCGDSEALEQHLRKLLKNLLSKAPGALVSCKKLILEVSGKAVNDSLSRYTALVFSEVVKGAEAKEGISAFFEKRKPVWPKKPEQ